jgi:hypothetical protein
LRREPPSPTLFSPGHKREADIDGLKVHRARSAVVGAAPESFDVAATAKMSFRRFVMSACAQRNKTVNREPAERQKKVHQCR